MARTIKFVIPGVPVAKGRPKFRRTGAFVQAYTPAKTLKAERLIRDCFNAMQEVPPKDYDHIGLTCNFYMPFNKSVSKKKRIAWNEKKHHIVRPDIDNLVKAIADALNGVAFKDDSAITCLDCCKIYSDSPRTEVYITYCNETE